MELTDDRNGLQISKSKRFCAIKGDNVISSIGASLQTLGAPNTPLWIVHSECGLMNLLQRLIFNKDLYAKVILHRYTSHVEVTVSSIALYHC